MTHLARQHRALIADGARFTVAGGINTLLSLAVYQVALIVLSPMVSYALAWAVGLLIAVMFFPQRIFLGASIRPIHRVMLAGMYIGVFLSGLIVLQLLVSLTGLPRLAIFGTLAVTTLLNFMLARIVVRGVTRHRSMVP